MNFHLFPQVLRLPPTGETGASLQGSPHQLELIALLGRAPQVPLAQWGGTCYSAPAQIWSAAACYTWWHAARSPADAHQSQPLH